ncbi:hypothetical protein BH10CHL1_BH10CHL1_18400 [soil metagenome]
MQNLSLRISAIALGLVGLLLFTVQRQASPSSGETPHGTIPDMVSAIQNNDFECTTGYYTQTNALSKTVYIPDDWNLVTITGTPRIQSARVNFAKRCDGDAHVERISGIDSLLVEAQDLEKLPLPGKLFDVAFYQQISATVGGAYSLSGWMLSLCGGSNVPNDCPPTYYMAKMLGIDPTGGTDPLASRVVWVEDRQNFIENGKRIGWKNLRTSAIAQATTITIFVRINSPFQWHGNHAFIDALSLVRAPLADLTLPATITATNQMTVAWSGVQSPDVTTIPGGTYTLYFDVQYRQASAAGWKDLVNGAQNAGSTLFTARCANTTYEFRVRARAEQPPAPPEGASPNQRYPGVWSEPTAVFFQSAPLATAPFTVTTPLTGEQQIFLPLVQNGIEC